MTTYVCVHGHAYQPPREDPATGEVPVQPSAAPYHDWNQRIDAECYAPLTAAKVLDADGTERSRTNLWGRVSFDLGPTLGVWMDDHATQVASAIADGDAAGGGAMAHPWVHAILPLTNPADRATVVRWGVDEFRSRYGRPPRGMWLPETAVDSASLEALVDAGIEWTMVAPHQILDADHRPVVVALPSGRTITVVPYDGSLSHGVAFGGLLENGVEFARVVSERALEVAGEDSYPLVVLSTDMETFGHHHRFGEMALARAVEEWDADPRVQLITVERYLDLHPASAAGSIVEFTSWSCAHGVERWRSNCGCRMDDTPGVDQRWRRPLRDLLDAVTDVAARLYAEHAGDDLRDPLEARHDYGVVLSARPADRERVRDQFLRKHRSPTGAVERCWAWMEAERLRLEAWSSCAWFFDTVDRIETQQVLAEARAALGRYAELTGVDTRAWFDAQVALLTPA